MKIAPAALAFRATRLMDVAALPAIERSAGQRFRLLPELAWIADDDVITIEQHQEYAEKGLSWLVLANEYPIGFLVAHALNASLFIVEVSLHLDWQGQGIGRQLILHVAENARRMGYPALTLTTFREVPWNALFYARLGFTILSDEALPADLCRKIAEETVQGLPRESRCAMRLMLELPERISVAGTAIVL